MQQPTQHSPSTAIPTTVPDASRAALLRDKGNCKELEQPIEKQLLEKEMLKEELVIEEVSIDGMCGVY